MAFQRIIIIAAAIMAAISATMITMCNGLLIMCRSMPNLAPSGSSAVTTVLFFIAALWHFGTTHERAA